MSLYYVYDLETFRNCFVFNGKFKGDPRVHTFEMSPRKNQRSELLSWLSYLQNSGAEMVGYNNVGFDYPIIHKLLNEPYTFTYDTAYQLCKQIIGSQQYGVNQYNIGYRERVVTQIDLYKINHFDNNNKRTTLKALQVAMRSESVEDLPYDPDIDLTSEQMDKLISYGIHDILETEKFLDKCIHLIDFRKELIHTGTLTGDVLNYSDVKIGTEYFVKRLGRAKCYVSGNTPRQTIRDIIYFKDIILPKIQFRSEEYDAVLQWFKEQKSVVKGDTPQPSLQVRLAGIDFFFGVGGVHASVENKIFKSDEQFTIIDIDVAGMYPAVAVANGFYPEHLGQDFVLAYKQLQLDRAQYKKGTVMNAVLKLAGNGVYGNSDNQFSPFYDPKYPKQVTVNGQLQILQLVEALSFIPGLDIIQANTDGITVRLPRRNTYLFDIEKKDWERDTGLTLEQVSYSSMFIRDVNNYICVSTDGKIKRKGAYWYPIEGKDYDGVWNKDFSMMCVPKAVEMFLIEGIKVETALKCITNKFDFMLRFKTPGGAQIYVGETPCSKTVRYYVSTAGQPMRKVAKPKGEIGQYKRKNSIEDSFFNKIMAEIGPNVWDERVHTKNKSKYEEVSTNIENGWLVKCCNRVEEFNWSDVDFNYYKKEVEKLIIGI